MKRIESVKNSFVKKMKQLYQRKHREKEGLFLAEGFHLVEEAFNANIRIDQFIVQEGTNLPSRIPFSGFELTIVSKAVMKELSSTETPQGIIAVCHLPEEEKITIEKGKKYLLVDGVQDPGNVGTLIRTADAVGLQAVLLGSGTVDPYNEKVIRASQGSLFHLPVIKGDIGEWMKTLQAKGIPIFGTAIEKGTSYTAIERQKEFALIVGNEGRGVNKEWLNKSDQIIYVPIYGNAESLNVSVATGILLYHLNDVR